MKTTVSLMIALMIIFASCKKNNTTPSAPAASQQNNSTANSATLTVTESQLAAKWYYEKSETITSDAVTATFVYTTTPSFNTVEFKCALSAATDTNNPNYKEMVKVQNGAIYSNMVWKINDVGILSMNLNGADPKALIDSLTTTRLVYTQYTTLQPLNGTRYYLHK